MGDLGSGQGEAGEAQVVVDPVKAVCAASGEFLTGEVMPTASRLPLICTAACTCLTIVRFTCRQEIAGTCGKRVDVDREPQDGTSRFERHWVISSRGPSQPAACLSGREYRTGPTLTCINERRLDLCFWSSSARGDWQCRRMPPPLSRKHCCEKRLKSALTRYGRAKVGRLAATWIIGIVRDARSRLGAPPDLRAPRQVGLRQLASRTRGPQIIAVPNKLHSRSASSARFMVT